LQSVTTRESRTKALEIERQVMSGYTHETVPTQFIEADGIRYAYRRFGRSGTVPLLLLEYFNSNMDGWDPEVTNSLAAEHELILFDNAGVGAQISPGIQK
jgi:hypothetical protein